VELAISRIPIDGPPLFTVFMHDISERKEAERLIADQAIRDPLTNLYNRRYFNDQAEQALTRAIRNNKAMALLFCDMDRFKAINDQRGHHTGDQVLKAVAENIQDSVRGSDLAFRWGGDEFVVILMDATREGILTTFNRIRKSVLKTSEEIHFSIDLSAGVAAYPEHGTNIDKLIRVADRALYRAKRGGEKIHIGEEEYQLDKHSIKIVFQPIFDASTGEILGYEALGRSRQKNLSIKQLFGRFESAGLLNEVKILNFKSQIKAAEAIGLKRLFINVDFTMLGNIKPFPKPEKMDIIMEISEEEAIQDVEYHLKVAENWKIKGYKFALDDFGVGFISLQKWTPKMGQ
jgi:diguanylate cyclase (GGDEF)-like protein